MLTRFKEAADRAERVGEVENGLIHVNSEFLAGSLNEKILEKCLKSMIM